jgi:hypothetical protein
LSAPGVNEIATEVFAGTALNDVGASGGAFVIASHEEPSHTCIFFVSVSKTTCPLNGEPGLVDDVQTVIPLIPLAIFA